MYIGFNEIMTVQEAVCAARCVQVWLQCVADIAGPFMLVMNSWLCVEADVTPCLLEKEEDTCTEKVLDALFFL